MNNEKAFENSDMEYMTAVVCDKTVYFDSSTDYSFPDYQPDIRRLLHVEARVLPFAKYMGANSAEFNGQVEYRILYMGGDGGIHALPTSSEYSVNIPFDRVNDSITDVVAFPHIEVENTSVRVVSADKISIKTKLCAHVRAYGKEAYGEAIPSALDANKVMRRIGEIKALVECVANSDVFEVTSEIPMPSDSSRVVYADGEVFVSDTAVIDGGVSFRGDVNIILLMCDEEGNTLRQERRIPVSGEIMCDMGETDGLSAKGYITDLSVSVEEDRIVCSADVTVEVSVMSNQKTTYLSDMYSTEKMCDVEKEEKILPICLKCTDRNFSINERIAKKDINMSEDSKIVECFTKVNIDKCVFENSKYVLTGNARFSLISKKSGEYTADEVAFPIRFETDGVSEATSMDISCMALGTKAMEDGENILLSCEAVVNMKCVGEERIRVVKNVSVGDDVMCVKGETVICFPENVEDIWAIAKKYNVCEDKIEYRDGESFVLINR
ncbi:MAG: DUF3794 domain-containing protein [Clostridia bacterium]|nr:DUF3794 domain-containing protein [Clostridia bacterium]